MLRIRACPTAAALALLVACGPAGEPVGRERQPTAPERPTTAREASGQNTAREAGGQNTAREASGQNTAREAGGQNTAREASGQNTAREAGGQKEGSVVFEKESRRYRVAVETRGGAVLASVEPRAHFHLSTEFPSKLEVSGAGIELASAELSLGDTSQLTEQRIEFSVPYANATADARVSGALTFGLCEEDLCERVTEEFDAAFTR